MPAIDRLIDKINETQAPIVVGLDPRIEKIPRFITDPAVEAFGNSPEAVAQSLYHFNRIVLDALQGEVPAVKLQMACYELYGSHGLMAYDMTVTDAKEKGLVVIDDSKRSDIGSTAELYAKGHLGKARWIQTDGELAVAEFLTVNPYLGTDSLQPFLEQATNWDKGLFVLVRTSNPGASQYQEAKVGDLPLYQKVAQDVAQMGQGLMGKKGYSSVGAVVGATWPQEQETLRQLMPQNYFLVPGYGAQGAGAAQVMPSFDQKGYGALVNSSRGVIFNFWKGEESRQVQGDEIARGVKQAVAAMKQDLLHALKEAGKLPENW